MDIILGKVALTMEGTWAADHSYPKLSYVTHEGDGWISRKASINVEPGTNDTIWRKATDVQPYIEAMQSATATATATNAAIAAAEQLRVQAENARVIAELARVSEEADRAAEEHDRAAAEAAREVAEASRESAEEAREAAEASREAAEASRESNTGAALNLIAQAISNANDAASDAVAASEEASAAASVAYGAASTANVAAAAADAAREAIEDDLAAKADTADLLDGSLVPAIASNLQSWAERGEREVVDEWSDPVRTTGGSLSIDSSKDAYILYLRSDGAFKADGIYASGENLLNPAESVGSAYVILVPKMLRGAYGTADEANGIVFCDNEGNNLHPTVRFSETYPTSATDGTAVTPYQFSGHSEYFYPSSKHGYFIVTLPSGKTAANTCARIAWSKDYNKFVAYTSPSFVSFASAIAAIAQTHSGVTDKMLAVGNVSDDIVFTTSAAAWTRRCSAYTPTWTSEATEDGQYLHTASIPDTNGAMKAGGAAASLDGSMEFETAGNVVSFVDSNASCSLTVKYELATVVTGSVTQSNSYAPNDLGIEYLDDVDGEFVIRTSYYQGIPDSVYSMLSRLEELEADFYALAAQQDELGDIHAKSIDTDELPKVCHYEMICIGSGAPTFIPDFIGQRYIDMTNKKSYDACGVSAASDWKANN